MPLPYLQKLLHSMSSAGLVETKRGYKGGHRLAERAKEVNLYDIVNIVGGVEWLTSCLLGQASCSDEHPCPMHGFWRVERERISSELRGLSLRNIADFERSREQSPLGECCPPSTGGDAEQENQ